MVSEFAFPANLSYGHGIATVTAFNVNSNEPVYQADERHPHWESILQGLRDGDDNVWSLFDVAKGVMSRFHQVTERISFDGENILFDGDPIHSVLADQLRRAVEDGNSGNYTALAKFWEKLESNPTAHSREQAYDWLACHKFQITEEGDVVGYKYVYETDTPGVFRSGHASQVRDVPSAFVNGLAITPCSTVPQRIGDVVSMPRSEVAHDPSQACKRGLHVGTYSYVGGGSRTAFEVHVNPRDIVSVPTDGGGAKVRVCRYKVAGMAPDSEPGTQPVLRDDRQKYDWSADVSYKA
jgi:hypothetical protein